MIRRAEKKDINQLKAVWATCFEEDTEQDINLFFDKRFESANGLVYECDGKIASMMFRLPCSFNGKNAMYLYALATLPEYQNKGYMSELIEYAHSQMQTEEIYYSLLLESTSSLCDYYKRFGYKKAFSYNLAAISGQADLSVLYADVEYVERVRKKHLKKAVQWDTGALNYANAVSSNADEHWFKVDDGYAIASKRDNISYISELVCTDAITAARSVNTYFGVHEAIIHMPAYMHIGEKVYRGMLYSVDGEEIKDAYISMTLE